MAMDGALRLDIGRDRVGMLQRQTLAIGQVQAGSVRFTCNRSTSEPKAARTPRPLLGWNDIRAQAGVKHRSDSLVSQHRPRRPRVAAAAGDQFREAEAARHGGGSWHPG